MNYVVEYYNKIQSGEIITSKRVTAVYKKMVDEITFGHDKYYFDIEAGTRPIEFIEKFCKQSQGVIGEPLILDLFQKAFIQALFGWLDKKTGFRRYKETMLLVGRKNGKTTLLAAIALYLMTSDYEGAAEVYCVATKKDQAGIALNGATNMIRQSPELRAVIKKRRTDVYFPMTASFFKALASESSTLDGLNSHGVIIDELHAMRDRSLYDVMKQSTSSRRQPLIIMITTAGQVRENIFDEMYKYACEVADEEKTDDEFLPILYELDNREEWTNPQMWYKANPGLGTIKRFDALTRFVERAKKKPEDLPSVLCKDFNIRENEASAWLTYDEIYNELTFDLKKLYNTYAIGGCDLSSTTDLTCATLIVRIPNDNTVYVLQHYFLPQSKIDKLDDKNTNEAPYKIWAERELLTICPGNRVNYSQVTEWFCQMRDEYKIDAFKIGHDRAMAGYWVEEMKSNGFDMEAVAQGAFTWSQPMREMGAAFDGKIINYNKNPMLVWCMSNTAVRKSGINNIQPIKITEKRRIDGTVSLLNAWVIYVKDYEDYMYWVG